MSKRSATGAAKTLVWWLFGGAIAATAVSCASGSEEEPTIEWATSEEELRFSHGPPPAEYFRFTPDWENTEWPPEGGRLEALNRFQTRCADGTFADSCHVAEFRIEEDWPYAPSYILRGQIQLEDGLNGEHSVFIGNTLWTELFWGQIGDADDVTFRVSKSRFECARDSCPKLRVERLNRRGAHLATELDASLLALAPDYLAWIQELATEDELIVSGELKRQRFQLWPRLVVYQVFLPPPVVECAIDEDCPAGTWCRATQTGGYVCEAYRGEGEECGAESGMEPRCAFPQVCRTSSFPNVPAVCRGGCRGHCESGKYCTFHGCLPSGTCETPTDCLHQANAWEHDDCPGYPTCEPVGDQALCVWHCGNPVCVDVTGFRGGGCSETLGYGRFGDHCGEVLGCEATSSEAPPLAETLEECETQCL